MHLFLSINQGLIFSHILFPLIFHTKNWCDSRDKSVLPSNILDFTRVHDEFESNSVLICELSGNEIDRNKIKRNLHIVIGISQRKTT